MFNDYETTYSLIIYYTTYLCRARIAWVDQGLDDLENDIEYVHRMVKETFLTERARCTVIPPNILSLCFMPLPMFSRKHYVIFSFCKLPK